MGRIIKSWPPKTANVDVLGCKLYGWKEVRGYVSLGGRRFVNHQWLASRGTNISPTKALYFLKTIFFFPRWDMLVPWRVYLWSLESQNFSQRNSRILVCQGRSTPCIGDGHSTFGKNCYNRYINPYYIYIYMENNGSLDPGWHIWNHQQSAINVFGEPTHQLPPSTNSEAPRCPSTVCEWWKRGVGRKRDWAPPPDSSDAQDSLGVSVGGAKNVSYMFMLFLYTCVFIYIYICWYMYIS